VDIGSGTVDESKNTGQVARIEGFIGSGSVKQWQQRYTYDTIGRLSKAKEVRGDNNAQVWQTAYTYNRWGNRLQSGAENSGVSFTPVVASDINTATNRFIDSGQLPVVYDDAGQITSDSRFRSMQYQYDANGRMRWAARLDGTGATSAMFDGGGQRVQTILNGSTRNFVYNISGQVVAEYRSGVLDREYIYQGGALLATDEQPRSCSLTTSTFVNNFYSGALNRQPNESESTQWTTSLNQAMAQGFDPLLTQAQSLGQTLFTSAEYSNGSNTDFVNDLYWAYLQRGPDQGGLDFWVYQLNQGASRAVIRQEFAISLEFQYKVAGVCSALGGTAAVKYVFMDHQGSTRALMDGNGTVLARHDYLPFGEELWANTGMRTTAQQFSAMDQSRMRYGLTEKDEATGLDHTWWRKYENTSGRWTSPDPLRGNVADPQSLNAYTYGNNDPVNLTDPTGLEPPLCIVDGFTVNCQTAGMFVNAGIGVQAPLNTTRFNPDGNGGGEWQLLRFVGQNVGWYNHSGNTVTARARLRIGDGSYWFAGSATWNLSPSNPYDPYNALQAGSDRWPPIYPPPDGRFGWPKPGGPPTVRLPPGIRTTPVEGQPGTRVPTDTVNQPKLNPGNPRLPANATTLDKIRLILGAAAQLFKNFRGSFPTPAVEPRSMMETVICNMNPNNPGCKGPPIQNE
jgi:RHS repeat-associated protein